MCDMKLQSANCLVFARRQEKPCKRNMENGCEVQIASKESDSCLVSVCIMRLKLVLKQGLEIFVLYQCPYQEELPDT